MEYFQGLPFVKHIPEYTPEEVEKAGGIPVKFHNCKLERAITTDHQQKERTGYREYMPQFVDTHSRPLPLTKLFK